MTSCLVGPRARLAVLIASLCAASTGSVRVAAQDVGTEAQRESGKKLYLKYCSQCHGEKGDGEGYAAPHLHPEAAELHDRQVQDSDDAQRSAPDPSGPREHHQARHALHLDARLACASPTSKCRISRTSSRRSPPDFSNKENVPKPVELPSAPSTTNESIELGKKLYVDTGCVRCHGDARPRRRAIGANAEGRLGPSDTRRGSGAELDLPGRLVPRGYLPDDEHGAQRDADAVVLRLAHARAAMGDHRLHRLAFGHDGPGYTNLVIAKHVEDPIDLAKGTKSFESAAEARFPIVGQIMEPGRAFHPPATSVTVQAIYDADSIALLVRWHDRSAEKTGTNGPSLPVPPEEEEEPAAAPEVPSRRERARLATRKWRPAAHRRPKRTPSRRTAAPAAKASEFSDAVSIQIPSQAPTGARKPYFIFGDGSELGGSLVLRSGPSRAPSVHWQGQRGHRSQRHG